VSSETIIVINPNSTVAVTEDIDRALAPLRFAEGPEIVCLTLAEGPPGIETQDHVDFVVAPIRRRVAAEEARAAAFVIACFSDPGLQEARKATAKPVFGIAECGLMSAMARAGRVGVIAILEASVARHRRFYRDRGIESPRRDRRRSPGARLRRHGPLPQTPRRDPRRPDHRPNPSRGHHGDRGGKIVNGNRILSSTPARRTRQHPPPQGNRIPSLFFRRAFDPRL